VGLEGYLQQPLSLPEATAAAVRKALLSGDLRPGDRLREADLAEQLGISRGPVREALRILEQQGVVCIEPRRGAYVRELSVEDAVEVYTLRAALEGLAVRLGVEQGAFDEQAIGQLQHLVDQLADLGETDDPLDWLESDIAFHDLLCRQSGHSLVLKVLSDVRAQIRQLHVFARFVPENLRRLADNHQTVLDAVAGGDPVAAESEIKDHIILAGKLYVESLVQAHEVDRGKVQELMVNGGLLSVAG
jgi:GntR family transcriptional regulator of gluconate operon